MKNFRIVADATFQAEDIEDALMKLSKHFALMSIANFEDSNLFSEGSISVEPKRKERNYSFCSTRMPHDL